MEPIRMRTANPDERVALRGVRMHATLVGLAQRTRVEQTFVNLEGTPIEAVYTFPLPDGAAVCAFEVVTGDRVLTGAIDETDAAVRQYESALAAGDGAYLAEQGRPDVFTVRVGNLNPRQAATVRLTYVRPLDVVDGAIRVAFPTTLAPRYATDSGTDPLAAAIDGDTLNPPHVLDVPYGLTLSADVRLGRRVAGITSPTHEVTVAGDDADGYRVSLAAAEMDREVVLSIGLAADVGAHVQVERGGDGASYLAVTFSPQFAEVLAGSPPPPAEVVFVIDCSGSMEGESIAQATAALELCLRTLNVGDTFNVCRFGSRFALMSPEPVPYTEATLAAAVAYVGQTRANLGGTELLAPLEAVLRPPAAAGRVRTVVLLTDGQVTNEPAVLALARRHRGGNRIFPFGIGPAVSTFLVNGLARATGGAAEFVAPGERIEAKVLRTFARVSSPVATDVSVDWGDADVQTLAELPPVFDGDVLGVFGRCAGKLPAKVTLRCRTAAGEQAWAAAVPPYAAEGDTVATMWARRAIQSLEEVNGDGRSAQLAVGSRERAEVIRLSKAFNLLSSLTTFVAVEHRTPAERSEVRAEVRRVPVQLPGGPSGVDRGIAAFASPLQNLVRNLATPALSMRDRAPRLAIAYRLADAAGSPPPPAPAVAAAPMTGGAGHVPVAGGTSPVAVEPSSEFEELLRSTSRAAAPVGPSSSPVAPTDAVDAVGHLLRLQSASGAFAWDEAAEAIAVARVAGWPALAERVVHRVASGPAALTLKALLLLERGFAAERALWSRAAEKALRFLAGDMGRPAADVTAMLALV
jgi:Ca-activated chloride channel family protein